MPLRQFVYFDDSLVDDFLAELEGGVSEEERQREQSSRGGKLGGRVGAGPVAVQGGRNTDAVSETERTVRQVRASKFQRLYDLLAGAEPPLIKEIDYDLDEELWAQVLRGDLISIDAAISIPLMSKMLATSGGMSGLRSLAELFSSEEMDAEAREAFDGFAALEKLGGRSDQLTVVGEVAHSPEYRLLCKMRTPFLIGQMDELETELTVVGKVQRKLRPSDYEFIGDFPGLSLMDRDTRRAFVREQRKDSDPITQSMFVDGPAAVISVLAVFR